MIAMIVKYFVIFQLRMFYSVFRFLICYVTKLSVVYLRKTMKISLWILVSRDSKPSHFLWEKTAFRKLNLFAFSKINWTGICRQLAGLCPGRLKYFRNRQNYYRQNYFCRKFCSSKYRNSCKMTVYIQDVPQALYFEIG